MSGIAPFQTAWDAVFAGSKSLHAYAMQALNSGLIKHAALGRCRQCADGSRSVDMLAAVEASLVLFAIDGPGTSMAPICSSPAFSNILDIAFLCKARIGSPILTQAGDALQQGAYLVLSEYGQLALIGIEDVGGRLRLNATQHSQALTQNTDGSEPRMLRKLVVDPLSRAVAIVSWLDYIEIVILAWATNTPGIEQLPQLGNSRIHISTDGAICDAAILMPSQTETQRVLLVAAIMDGEGQSHFLHLYEIWTYGSSNTTAPNLAAKLPLPFDMATPLHIIPLPAFPEHFVFVTENEIVLASALQLLSGDIHLYRQPLPQLSNGVADLVQACCVAGTVPLSACDTANDVQGAKSVLQSPLLSRRTSATSSPHPRDAKSGCDLAQLLYISLQSGTMLRVYAAPMPLLSLAEVTSEHMGSESVSSGDVMLHLGRESPYLDQTAFDYVFLSGNCATNAIVKITAPNDHSDDSARFFSEASETAISACAPLRWTCPVFENQSPTIDFTLHSDKMYLTSGYAKGGSILRAQFGHVTRLLGKIGADAEDRDSSPESELVAPLWSFCVPSLTQGGAQVSCVVLQHAGANIPVVEDGSGGWQVLDELHAVIAYRQLSFIGNIDESRILCIFRDSINVVHLETGGVRMKKLVGAGDGETFTHGACVMSGASSAWAAVAVLASRRVLLCVFQISASNTETVNDAPLLPLEVVLDHDVSCLRIFAVDTGVILAAGTYAPGLHLFWVSAGSSPPAMVPVPIDLQLAQSRGEQEDLGDSMRIDTDVIASPAVSDVYILRSQHTLYVLAGLRDGRLVWSATEASLLADVADDTCADLPLFGDSVVLEAGKVPVSFTSTASHVWQSACDVLMCSGLLYMVKIGRLSQLEITPCRSDNISLAPIHCIMPLAAGDGANVDNAYGERRFLATSSSGGANVIGIEPDARCSLCPYPVNSEPRRIVVDEDTGMLLVASIVRPPNTMVGPSFLTSSLKVVDPDSGNICAEVQFRPFELVRSLATWHIRGHKSYRYVCVGTAQFLEQSDSQSKLTQQAVGGRLVIYNLKPTKRKARAKATPLSPGAQQGASAQLGAVAPGFELKYVWESDRNGSVSALASLGDSYLVVAVDATCIVLKLDVVQKRLIECCECSLRFAATSLDVCGSDIVVGSKREAVNVLRFTPAASDGSCDVLELVHSARFGGNTADARFLASDLVAGVDHNGFLFVVGIPGNTAEFALDFVLGMHLGTECSRLRAGQLVQRLDAPEHVMSWSGSPNNVSGDNQDAIDYLLVSTISGAMWTLARISDDSFALLRCLELAMLDMPALHPARPLLAGNGSLNRARITSTLQSVGTIDGTFSTVFADNLTDVERAEVIRSSPELLRLALAIADRSKATFYSPEHGSDPTARAATAIARLISSLNSISVC